MNGMYLELEVFCFIYQKFNPLSTVQNLQFTKLATIFNKNLLITLQIGVRLNLNNLSSLHII
jgi:hypothetical protein